MLLIPLSAMGCAW